MSSAVIPPVPTAGLEILQYDPTYYVAYDVTQGVTFSRPDCSATITDPCSGPPTPRSPDGPGRRWTTRGTATRPTTTPAACR